MGPDPSQAKASNQELRHSIRASGSTPEMPSNMDERRHQRPVPTSERQPRNTAAASADCGGKLDGCCNSQLQSSDERNPCCSGVFPPTCTFNLPRCASVPLLHPGSATHPDAANNSSTLGSEAQLAQVLKQLPRINTPTPHAFTQRRRHAAVLRHCSSSITFHDLATPHALGSLDSAQHPMPRTDTGRVAGQPEGTQLRSTAAGVLHAAAGLHFSAPANVQCSLHVITGHESVVGALGGRRSADHPTAPATVAPSAWHLLREPGEGSTGGCDESTLDLLGFTQEDLEELEGRHLTPRADRSSRGSYFSLPDLALHSEHEISTQVSEGGTSSGSGSRGEPLLRRVNTGGSARLNTSSGGTPLLRQSLTRAAALHPESVSIHRRTASSGAGAAQTAMRPPLPTSSLIKTAITKTYIQPTPALYVDVVPPPSSLPGLKMPSLSVGDWASSQSATLQSSPPGCSIRSDHMSGSSRHASPNCNSPLWLQPETAPAEVATVSSSSLPASCPVPHPALNAVISTQASKEHTSVETADSTTPARSAPAQTLTQTSPGHPLNTVAPVAAAGFGVQQQGCKFGNSDRGLDVLANCDALLLSQTSDPGADDVSSPPSTPTTSNSQQTKPSTATLGGHDTRDVPCRDDLAPPPAPATPAAGTHATANNNNRPSTTELCSAPPTDALEDHLASLTTITTSNSRPASTPNLKGTSTLLQQHQQHIDMLFGASHRQPPLLMPGRCQGHPSHHSHTCPVTTSPLTSSHSPGGPPALGRSSSPCLASVPEADNVGGCLPGGKATENGSANSTAAYPLPEHPRSCASPHGGQPGAEMVGAAATPDGAQHSCACTPASSSTNTPFRRWSLGLGGDLAPTPDAPCRHHQPAFADLPALPLGLLARTSHQRCQLARTPGSSSSVSSSSGWHVGVEGSARHPGSGPDSGSGQMLVRPCCGCSMNGCGSLSSWGSAMSVASLVSWCPVTTQRSTSTSSQAHPPGTPVML